MPTTEAQVVYISGFARSGSTLLGEIIGAQEGAFHVGELLVGLRRLAANKGGPCTCGEGIESCPVWSEVFRGFPELTTPSPARARALSAMIKEPILQYPSPTAEELELAEIFALLYQRIAIITGSDIIVDSSKSVHLGRLLNVHVIHLVREPRAAVHSRNRSARRRGRLTPGRPREVKSIVADARRWTTVNRAQRTGSRTELMLRYEDLVSPSWTCEVAGLTVDRDAFITRPSVGHTLWGNPAFRRSIPRLVKADTAWREAMPQWQQAIVRTITSAEYRYYA
jgi:hypothetical protein